MKKILIRCYTNLNLGDDLFIKILCERYPKHKFQLVCDEKNSIPFKEIKNLEIISTENKLRFLGNTSKIKSLKSHVINNTIAKKSDATVHIGGSIFIQPKENWRLKVNKYRSLISNSNNFYVIGCNFGPYDDLDFLAEYRNIFAKINDISFRDKKSYDLFSELPTVRYSPDVVFGLDTEQISEKKTKPYIAISVLDLNTRPELVEYIEVYEKFIIDISTKIINKGYEVVLMSFCESEGDEEAINRLFSEINNQRVKTHFYNGDMDDTLEVMKSSKGIIATRFHSLILAWILNKPAFPIIYSNKTLNVIEDMNFKDQYSDMKELSNVDLNAIISQLTSQMPFNVSTQIKESSNHFKRLDHFLNKDEL